ncbi:MAG: metal ABC transporter ATP-binding protein [Verrucomicrobia bacterium]|nr:metal ABC transporter ATP-binding protein [Verrucomicrobiota bacterium]
MRACSRRTFVGKAFSARNLSVNYGKTSALWDLSFSIPEGLLVAMIGPNGAGKSSLLKAAMGIVKPVTGSISFFGQEYPKVRRRIGYVPQRETVDWDFPITVIDLVLMGCYGRVGLFGRLSKKERDKAMEALERVGMSAYVHRQISQLSGGQQQRVFLARALVQEADLIFLDEPFAGVDVGSERVIMEILRELQRAGKTLFVVQHDLTRVAQDYDWAMLINVRLVACGPCEEVFTPEALERTYGKGALLFTEAQRLSRSKTAGLI